MTTMIHLDGSLPIAVLDEKGWAKGAWTDNEGHVCAHQAIRLCAPVPGDAHLIEQVAKAKWGRGPDWNDDDATTEADVRAWLSAGIDVTDVDLADTFGPQWQAVVEIVRAATTITPDQAARLAAAWVAARVAAWDAAWDAAWVAARDAARDAAWDAAWVAAWDAAWVAAGVAAGDVARVAARAAAWAAASAAASAAAVWDLTTSDGPFTYAQRDLLMAPWVEVFGLPASLAAEAAS